MIGTLRRELLDQLLTEYLLHYNTARPHRSRGQLTPAQADSQPSELINLSGTTTTKTGLGWLDYVTSPNCSITIATGVLGYPGTS